MVNNFFKNICTSNIITLWCLVYISEEAFHKIILSSLLRTKAVNKVQTLFLKFQQFNKHTKNNFLQYLI